MKKLHILTIASLAINALIILAMICGYLALGKDAPIAMNLISQLKQTSDNVDLAAQRDQLRALGIPDDTIRAIITTSTHRAYNQRQRELLAKLRTSSHEIPYWQRGRFSPPRTAFDTAQLAELQHLRREADNHARELLGPAPEDNQIATNGLAHLSEEKALRKLAIERDYDELIKRHFEETSEFLLPSDRDRLTRIQQDKQRDLDALLTPEEHREDRLRNSFTASEVIAKYGSADLTENEYKRIFDIQDPIEETAYARQRTLFATDMNPSDRDDALMQMLDEKQKKQDAADKQIRDIIGPERLAKNARAKRVDYTTLQSIAQRFNLPETTIAQVYQTRDEVVVEARDLHADPNLNSEQYSAACSALEQKTTAQICAALGDEIGTAYMTQCMGWISALSKPGRVEITPDGDVHW